MKSNQKILLVIFGFIIIGVGGFYFYQKFRQKTSDVSSLKESSVAETMQLANPASGNCLKLGGKLVIQKRGDGGEYGVCFFEDNKQCEEWALLRGDCPVGGLTITGYENNEDIYCLITGGKIEGLNTDTSMCKRVDGTLCTSLANFNGACPDPNNPTPDAGNVEVQ